MMQLVASINGGWSECDVCGNGSAIITIHREGPMESYQYVRESPCYGNITRYNLTVDELLDQMKADTPLVHTRRGRRAWRNTTRKIADGQVFWKKRENLATHATEPESGLWLTYSPVALDTAPTVAAINQMTNAIHTTSSHFTITASTLVDWDNSFRSQF